MKISFHGAAEEVTGSCSLIETKQTKVLVDCGMFQGDEKNEEKNFNEFKFNPEQLDAVIVTHAHLDHVGRLPLLINAGYDKEIYATLATIELAKLILEDALHVMEYEYRKTGKAILYDLTAVEKTISQFVPLKYEENKILSDEINFTFHDAGHIFGSAFVEMNIEDKRVVFSGDIGNTDVPILRNTTVLPDNLDLVICESTYGGRVHEAKSNAERELIIERFIINGMKRGGVIMIPSFALERTQQLLYILNDLVDRKKVIPRIPIFLDSPLAIRATEVYREFPEYYDEEAMKLYKADDDLFDFRDLTTCLTREESKKINVMKGQKIIIAGAGMMNGGRIIHHAKRYLSDSSNTLFFIGYQAKGTLGRKILEGASQVTILKDKIPVKCNIEAMGALSAHADQEKILDWLGGGNGLPKKVVFNHGEVDQAGIVSDRIQSEFGIETSIANIEMVIEL